MNGDVICGECPAVYPPSLIEVWDNDKKVSTLADLNRDAPPEEHNGSRSANALRKFMGVRAPRQDRGPDLRRLRRLRDYSFSCPKGHKVDGNAGEQFPLAVLGASGASKSHILPAIVYELEDKRALSKLGITLTDALYSDPKIALDVRDLYRQGLKLNRTTPGTLLGPFGYKLTIRRDEERLRKLSLILFDVAGEDLQGIVKIAEKAQFILLCEALVILIDPVDILPTEFESNVTSERARIHAASDVRAGIRVIADTLAEVWGVESSHDLRIPVCFVLAKADSIRWADGFPWATQTGDVVNAAGAEDGDVARALAQSSTAVRQAFLTAGGSLIVEEIEELFDDRWVRWVAASATSTMPKDAEDPPAMEWQDYPDPNGVALSLLQLLDMSGVLAGRAAPAA